ncbi:MAG TPA: AMP-binding protein [Acidimicrobiales bacterium]|nr:AMP-binding protein [Acidimicrobiales bacterium]
MPRPLDRATLLLRRDHTLGNLMDRLERAHGDRQLVVEADGGLSLTYAQAAKRVRRWAGGISTQTSPGDVVVIATANGYEQLLLCMAAARAGTLPAPVNDQMRREEVDHVVRDSGATLVLRSAAAVDDAPPLIEPASADTGDVGALFYTSGTTGSPKGAALTHRALVGQISRAAMWPTRLHRDEAVIALPVAHIMGFAALIGLAFAGIPTYLLPRFNPVKVLDAIEERRATMFIGVPAMYRMLDEAGAQARDLTSVRVWAAGADAMPPDLAERFKKMGATLTVPLLGAVGQAAFAEGYGMVEVGGGVAAKLSPPFLGTSAGPLGEALGFALPGYELRVVDDDGAEVPSGQVGELQVKGPGVLRAYWGDEEATAAVLTDDGWLRTGDLARKGPFGLLVFEGRSKHVIKHGGYSVYALEVEQALEQHPDVLEAVVVGLPDERLGEVPGAVVRLEPGADLEALDLGTWAGERLADYKVPKRFVAVDDLPRTGTAKVQKAALVELFDSL